MLQLIDRDRLPGQPAITPAGLSHALRAGEGLESAGCDVLVSADDAVLGAVSYAVPKSDSVGVLLWLHCLEDEQSLAQMLVDHTLTELGRRTVHAYAVPTAMAPAGLPMRNRPGTRRALEACGFSGTDRWRYLHHSLDTLSPRVYAVADLIEHAGGGWQLFLRERGGIRIGEACISAPIGGAAVLEWVTLAPERRRLGHILLEQCLTKLADRGIDHVTTCLHAPDFDNPHYEAALHLHEAAGFTVADQLHTYVRCP
ncbi:hypothetical protein [Streptomyces sp. NPDC056069]|uniref:hypothetical protein n=1 Tax=Streptomyces sp. NPDC056069 TaxID=3345702 RepID=UPI0035E239A2